MLDRFGLGWDHCNAGLQALDAALSCKKNQKEEGPARAMPVAAPMPKSYSSQEKKRDFLDCLVLAYLSLMNYPCIYSGCPAGWVMNGVCSHLMRSLPYSQP